MRSFKILGNLVIAAAIAMSLAGCSGGEQQIAPAPLRQSANDGARSVQQSIQNHRALFLAMHRSIGIGRQVSHLGFMSPDAVGKPLIFISIDDLNTQIGYVDFYRKTGKNQRMVGQIIFPGGGVGGLATDTAANLYVAIGSSIQIYAPPYTGAPTSTLDDSGYFPQGVAVSSQGVVAVANFCDAPNCDTNSGSVTFYAKNSITPCATISAPALPYGAFAAFDAEGNLYVDGYNADFSAPVIGKINGGCNAKNFKILTTSNTLDGGAFSVHVSNHDRVSIMYGGGSGEFIDTYKQPIDDSLGAPVLSTPVELNRPPLAVAFTFSSLANVFYCAEQGGGGLLTKYDFPKGIAPENTVVVGNSPMDVAVTPRLEP
jgi:hypothetical protein